MSGISIVKDATGNILISGDVAELAVVKLEPHHTLVLRCKGRMGPEHVQQVHDVLAKIFPDNKCLILMPDIDLTVMEGKKTDG